MTAVVPRLRRLNTLLSENLLGGPKRVKLSWVINLHKAGTVAVVPLLMWWAGNWSTVAWVYWALHGSYGLCWLLKDRAFPDRAWEKRVTWASAALVSIFPLALYWVFPLMVVTRGFHTWTADPSNALLAGAIALHTLGVVLMMTADAQKHFTLALRRGLLTTGLYARVRHPNYLGEMMLYSAYALLAGHWAAWVVLLVVWGQIFLVNMLSTESSVSRYPEWPAYRGRSGMLFPRI
jgi:protein-S-isoprenylcysteine O-methyltransferase Ste14